MAEAQHDPAGEVRMRFRRAPLAAAALWFALGIGASRFTDPPLVFVITALTLLAAMAVFALTRPADSGLRVAWLPVAALWLVTGLAAAKWQPGTPQQIPLAQYADGLSRTVRGRITRIHPVAAVDTTDRDADHGETEDSAPAERALSVDLDVTAAERLTPDISELVPAAGGIRAFVYPDAQGLLPVVACGDSVELQIRLRLPERYRDPGVFQYADTLLGVGIGVRGSLSANRLKVVAPAQENSWRQIHCRIEAAQSWAAGRMAGFAASYANHHLPPLLRLDQADAAMLNAMLFGDRSGLSHALRIGFERTGSFHLFVVSGLHVALLAAGVFWLLRRLRLRPWLATCLTLAISTAYTILTGFGQPVQRALAMTALFLLTKLLSREGNRLNALGAVALAMLLWSPASLFEASFQMTVLAVIAIAGIAAPLGERTVLPYARGLRNGPGAADIEHPRVAQLRLMTGLWGEAFVGVIGHWAYRIPRLSVRVALWAAELALIGIVAELVMVLPMAMYFHRAAVFALPANMVVIPLIAVLAPLAVATFVASLLSPWLAIVPGAAAALLLHLVRWGIARLSGLAAADVRVPGPVWWVAAIAVALWLSCCWAVRRGRIGAWAAVFALPAIAVFVLWPEPALRSPGLLEITAIDVGQGDSLLVTGPTGASMLIDAGGPVGGFGGATVSEFDLGEQVVSPYLWSRRMRRLDVVALTHAHSDHMGGMAAVLRNFRPRELWVGIDPGSTGYAALLHEAILLGIKVRHLHAGDAVGWDRVNVSVLAPAPEYRNAGTPKNDDSLVMRLDFGAASALLEGDAERRSEQRMIADGHLDRVTLLKVGHHGSLSSTTPEFLAAVAPRDAVISVGTANPFGHPREEVIERIAASGARLYRTDQFGLTSFLLGRDGSIHEVVTGSGGQ